MFSFLRATEPAFQADGLGISIFIYNFVRRGSYTIR
jgi:hypothetical protein